MNSLRRPALACLLACLLSGCFGGAAKPRPEVRVRAETLIQRAVRAEHKGDLPEAENLLTESLRLSTSIEDNPAMAAARINLARLYRLRHDTARAREAIDGALALLAADSPIYAEAAQEKARVELSSNSALALEWAQKAVAAEKGNFTGRRLNLLGRIQVAQGDLTAADDTLKKALDANRSNELREEEANSLRMLGIVARKQHRFVDAERLLTEALELDKLLGVSVKIGTDLEELALTARDAGKPEKAVDYLGRACDVHLNGGRPGQAGADITALADLYGHLGDSRKAEAARRRAREITAGQTSQKPGRSVETTNPSSSP